MLHSILAKGSKQLSQKRNRIVNRLTHFGISDEEYTRLIDDSSSLLKNKRTKDIAMGSKRLPFILMTLAISALFWCMWSSQHRRYLAYDSLTTAIEANDISAVRAALDHGIDIDDVPVFEGTSPLRQAAYEGKVEIVRLLLDRGADIDGFDGWSTPLDAAAENDQAAVIELLLARGAPGRDEALIRAAEDGKVAAVRVLLAHGANPNSGTHKGEKTLLQVVKENHHPDVAALLLKAGAK